jgi:hypothetical protein
MSEKEIPSHIAAVYSALASKHAVLNQLLWQAPMISLSAQAFLLTIAYGSGQIVYRVVAGFISLTIGLASWQLFCRHALLERLQSIQLLRLERKYFGEEFHNKPKKIKGIPIACIRSRRIWEPCLYFLSFAGLFPLIEFIFT